MFDAYDPWEEEEAAKRAWLERMAELDAADQARRRGWRVEVVPGWTVEEILEREG